MTDQTIPYDVVELNKTLAYCYSIKEQSLTIVDVTDPATPIIAGVIKDSLNLRDIDKIIIKTEDVARLNSRITNLNDRN